MNSFKKEVKEIIDKMETQSNMEVKETELDNEAEEAMSTLLLQGKEEKPNPIKVAIWREDLQLLKEAIGSNPDFNQVINGYRLLESAALTSSPAIIEFLVANGADIDYQDKNGYTALMIAMANRKKENVECLLKLGANPHLRNCAGKIATEL